MAAEVLPMAPGALGGQPNRGPPGSPLWAGRRLGCPSACSPTVVAVKQLAPAACAGTAAAAADFDRTDMLAEVEFFVGENVRYWSDTHGIWMEASVARINFSVGKPLTYDLDVKRGARADRIKKITPRPLAAQDDGALPPSEACPTTSLPRTAKGLKQLLVGDPSGGEGGNGGGRCEVLQTVAAAAVAEAVSAVKASRGATESCDACVPVPTAAKLPEPVPLVDEEAPLPKFEVGNQVVYWSDTYHQWMEATVVKKREGGATYDLDVKKGAHARKMRLVQSGERLVVAAAAQDERTSPSRPHWSGPSSPLQAGKAVQANSPSAVVVAAPQADGVVNHPAQMAPALSPQSSRGQAATDAAARDCGAQGAPPQPVATTAVRAGRRTVSSGVRAVQAPPAEERRAPACLFMGTGVEGRAFVEKPPSARSAAALAAAQQPRRSPGAGAAALEAGELHITARSFNPSNPSVRAQLLALLGLGPGAVIEEMKGFRGGLNEGVWFVSDRERPALGGSGPGRELVLKLVRGTRIDQNLLTEGENLQKIAREHPKATSDPALAFPLRVVAVVGPGGARRHDLIVMRKVRGERLAEVIARKWYRGEVSQIMRLLERLGTCLGEFHARYSGVQHGDFQPSNIIYDDERDALVMIDVGGMGVPTMQGDVAHFCKSLRLLAEAYGTGLANDGTRRFEQGYAQGVAAGRLRIEN